MSILNSTAKAARIAVLEPKHATVNSKVSAVPQTATQVAASAGISNGPGATAKLSLLVDEGLVARSAGDPNAATYTLA